jgi:endonuclease III
VSRTAPKRRPRARRTRDAPVRAPEILTRLRAAYPDARCALDHRGAFELLCATILSAQCTDVRVNLVTPVLFGRYPTPETLARARQADVEEIIRSTGFFRNKARNLIGMAQALVADYGGEVPRTMEQLQALPGVGRKTANVILGNAYGINEGITVDTHVTRLSRLLGLTRHADPVKIEQDLMALFPRDQWALLSHLLIFHGRQVCVARRPRCHDCVLSDLCPSSAVEHHIPSPQPAPRAPREGKNLAFQVRSRSR